MGGEEFEVCSGGSGSADRKSSRSVSFPLRDTGGGLGGVPHPALRSGIAPEL